MYNEKRMQEALEIDNLRTDRLLWNDIPTESFVVNDGKTPFGVVKSRYVPVSHAQAVSQAREFLSDAPIVGFVANKNLSAAVFTFELPKVYTLDGEIVKPRLNLWNSFDGTRKLGFAVSLLQVTCFNIIKGIGKRSFVTFSGKHTANLTGKYSASISVLQSVEAAIMGSIEAAEKLKNHPLTTEQGIDFFNRLAEKKLLPMKVAKQAGEIFAAPRFDNEKQRNALGALNSLTDILTRRLEESEEIGRFEALDLAGVFAGELQAA